MLWTKISQENPMYCVYEVMDKIKNDILAFDFVFTTVIIP